MSQKNSSSLFFLQFLQNFIQKISTFLMGSSKKNKYKQISFFKKYSIFFQIMQLTCIYFFAIIVLFTSILGLLNSLDISSLYVPIFQIPILQSILQSPIVLLVANPEKNFFIYLIILEFVINRPVFQFSILVKYNILLIFTLEMFQNLIFAYWDLLFNKEMFADEITVVNKNIAFVVSFLTLVLFLTFYLYSYFRAIRGKFVRFPYMEWLTDSVAFWLRIKTSTMDSGKRDNKRK